MKEALIQTLELMARDIDDAIQAIKDDRMEKALAKFELLTARLKDAELELRS